MLKVAVLTILAIAFVGSLVWLWERQPHPSQILPEKDVATNSAQEDFQGLTLKTTDNLLVANQKLEIEGKTFPNEFVAIYSNDFQHLVKSSKDGDFSQEITLAEGLNLLTVATISAGSEKQFQKSLTLYFARKVQDAERVFAGSVKNIFDTLITVSENNQDKNIRTSKSTDFDIPDPEEATSSPVENVRIGDYAIGLGNAPENSKDTDTIIASSLEIIREDKPQNRISIAQIKIISPIRQNIFSASVTSDVTTNTSNKKVLEFMLDKNTEIFLDGQDAETDSIAKDKSAIILYTKMENNNLINLIYLLP